jgi:hypothetical protein
MTTGSLVLCTDNIIASERDIVDGLNTDEIIDRFSLLTHHFQSCTYLLDCLDLNVQRYEDKCLFCQYLKLFLKCNGQT